MSSPLPTSAERTPRRHGLAASFRYAFAGLAAGWRSQPNFRIHVVLALVVVAGGALARISAAGWAIVALAIGLVLAAELFNTAVEAVVDLVSPDDHPLAKRAKDVAAAAVLVAALAAVVAGAAVLAGALGR